ncbi:glutamine--tRNA ligase/YqeY domain fusion protein [bacterium]|nr:glutamine--tRNA ligase/YqeY domain fusion protein [bacterium]
MADAPNTAPTDFIRQIIHKHNRTGRFKGRVETRFPPEPNGYLHIGHAKAIIISFGIAKEFGGVTHLRFDDTNPVKEDVEFTEAIKRDIHWLGFDWGERLHHASDYFETLYDWAIRLIEKGVAFVCDLNAEQMREYRGTLTEPGKNSPFRERSIEENLDLFKRMRAGEFPDGAKTLRAKIDMSHPNINMRDPVMYRILHKEHHQAGDKWCIYPTYDWAHGQSDSIEGITHSLCSLEFENHRPLYDWFLDQLEEHHPQQIEFARLNMTHVMMSKRNLLALVKEGVVAGWDDPRMPTLSGLRRRGVQPNQIRSFVEKLGVSKSNSTVEYANFEHTIREDFNAHAPRVMGVLRPLKVVITNYPEGQTEEFEAVNNPENPEDGTRMVPFSRELYIEQDDFQEEPHRKFHRLYPGNEVRLRYAYFITCTDVIKDADGTITELHCTYDPASRGGNSPDGRKVKGTIHWVSAEHAVESEVRLYQQLFLVEDPNEAPDGGSWKDNINPDSLEIIPDAKLEPSLADKPAGWFCQFERLGYFTVDPDSKEGSPVFNRTITLRDTWAKIQKKG